MTRDSIRALVDAATPGPWAQQRYWPLRIVPEAQVNRRWGASGDPVEDARYARAIASSEYDEHSPDWVREKFPHRRVNLEQSTADAAFIAASRTAVPLLLAVADAAENVMDGNYPPDLPCDAHRWAVLRDALAALEAQP